ncbi:hypothetical protein [Candidatus Odyssella acanthamoebae]|uniref:Uncharacterized protein n=1 Tax=Candidatus Odyssella acanthamoebae TaxID=91604 RepID=A0A077ATQ7_9PROT|nr:hypothetical protein [Candidatus Paracaedibacter acanthamoebae]AIK96567.1 hypothetical protein ID47_07250 [Candidatus Paracaedibacter acanthamoebae]
MIEYLKEKKQGSRYFLYKEADWRTRASYKVACLILKLRQIVALTALMRKIVMIANAKLKSLHT